MSSSEFQQGSNAVVIGNEVAELFFVNPERAVGKLVSAQGKKLVIVGVIKKQGNQMLGGWQLDKAMICLIVLHGQLWMKDIRIRWYLYRGWRM